MPLLITHLRGCTAALAVPWGSSRKTLLFRYWQPSIKLEGLAFCCSGTRREFSLLLLDMPGT